MNAQPSTSSPRRRGRPRVRRLLTWIAVTAGVLVLVLVLVGAVVYTRADVSTVGTLDFEQELRIPPLLEPRAGGAGSRAFDIELQAGRTELLAGKPTETWGANGTHLGPTLRASRGDTVRMEVRNELPQPTSLHWHGMRLPAVADGGPHQLIEPGRTWSPTWTVDQPAATLWYHAHPRGNTEDQVYRGLAGMFILDDPEASKLALPHTYGVDDIPLILQDKRLDDDGRLELSRSPISPTGRLGDDLLVNGTHDPHLDIRHERVRLRLVNASGARVYNIGFADRRDFHLVGTDGGLLAAPRTLRSIQLSPGERAEIVAAFRPGERAVIRSFAPKLGTNFFLDRLSGGDDSFDVLEIRAAAELAPQPEVPKRLAPRDPLGEEDAARTRRFELGGRSINGRSMDMSRIDEVVAPGTTEVWELRNNGGTPHNFHVHGVTFDVLEYAGGPPPPELGGPKDTLYLQPGETARIATRFDDYADPDHPYMFHCHLLAHEDGGMMGQFVVSGR